MSKKYFNLVRVTTPTTGTSSTVAVGNAIPGFISFAESGIQHGDRVSYGIEDGVNRELAVGTYSAISGSITRTTIVSTDSNNPIALSGQAQVYVTVLSEDLETLQSSVISVDSVVDLQNLHPEVLTNGRQFSVRNVGMFFYDNGQFYPQTTNMQSGTGFPADPSENQLFLLEPDQLYVYSDGDWHLISGLKDAPGDGTIYGRRNGSWIEVTSGFDDAPVDGEIYGRKDGNWVEVESGIEEAPTNGNMYGRVNGSWDVIDVTFDDAPADNNSYVRRNNDWTILDAGIEEAPIDGIIYGRNAEDWVPVPVGIEEAPGDGEIYGRSNNSWMPILGRVQDAEDAADRAETARNEVEALYGDLSAIEQAKIDAEAAANLAQNHADNVSNLAGQVSNDAAQAESNALNAALSADAAYASELAAQNYADLASQAAQNLEDLLNDYTGTFKTFVFTVVDGQTSVSGTDDNGNNLEYIPSRISVYRNGVKLIDTENFTATNGTSISFNFELFEGDTVEVVAFNLFVLVDDGSAGIQGFALQGGGISPLSVDSTPTNESYQLTPFLYGTVNAGNPTYTVQRGVAQVTGNMCLLNIDILLSDVGGMEGDIRIGGLPFAITALYPETESFINVIPTNLSNLGTANTIYGLCAEGESAILLCKTGIDSEDSTALNDSNIKNTSRFRLNGWFYID